MSVWHAAHNILVLMVKSSTRVLQGWGTRVSAGIPNKKPTVMPVMGMIFAVIPWKWHQILWRLWRVYVTTFPTQISNKIVFVGGGHFQLTCPDTFAVG